MDTCCDIMLDNVRLTTLPKTAISRDFFNINIATRANKKPSSHLMFEFHVGFGGCLRLILDISDYNDYKQYLLQLLNTHIQKNGKASTLHHQLQKGQGSQAFQDLFSNPTIVGHSNLVPPVTGGRHRNPYSAQILLYEAAIPPLKNVRHTVYLFRSQTFSSCLKKRFPRNPCCPWDSESNFWQQFLMMQRFLMGE